MEISKSKYYKLKDPTKYYVNVLKGKKDIIKYLEKTDKLEVVSVDVVDLVGNVYTQERYNELLDFYEGNIEKTCKQMLVKITDKEVDLTNDKFITIFYNDLEDLKEQKDFYDLDSEIRQVIYLMRY